MTPARHFPILLCTLLFLVRPLWAAVIETDICVYGGTSGGVIAAVQAARQGKSVALAVVNMHVGGMTSGGLGQTDVGNSAAIAGISREFYERIATKYSLTGAKFTFEPHVAEEVFNTMLSEVGVTPRWNQRLSSVTKSGAHITQIFMDDGTIYRARVFIDASYEGDLMAMAGVSYTIGREATTAYNESLNGIRASTPAHQFTVNVDPYVVPGNAGSGLLPFIQAGNGGTAGAADSRVQAYNFRLCFTNSAANRLPIAAPAGYDESRYELLGRLIEARVAASQAVTPASFMNISSMPNSKTDINNNGAFSTDFIGMSDSFAQATPAQRAVLTQQFLEYTQGFYYCLQNSLRVPAATRTAMLAYGLCADEFKDTGGWPHQLYVREARRMISDYVMQQQDCQGTRVAADPIALGSYTMDAHNAQRVVQGGVVKNEGDVQSTTPAPYGISFRSIVPRQSECDNLVVPWALSATHVGFGSIRMEPVFMELGQSAGSAAVFAIDEGVPIQQINYAKLALQLVGDKQLITWGTTSGSSVIVDNADSTGVTMTGAWTVSSSSAGLYGANYLHDQSIDKGTKSVRFTPNLPTAGDYDVYIRWPQDPNRSTNVPVDVISNTGTDTFTLNQTANGGTWVLLRRATFSAGTGGSVLVRTTGTAAGTFVIADAVRFVSTIPALPTVQIVASDAVAREGAGDPARVTLVRSAEDVSAALTVRYTLSGTAQSGVDFTPLSGSATIAAGTTTASLAIQAIADSLAKGARTLTLNLQSDPAYTLGTLNSASVQILDRPIDAWRFANFSAAELAAPAISGDLADPDGDGLSNLTEYAMGLNPRGASALGGAEINSGNLTWSYTRLKNASDVSLIAEGSLDLVSWTAGVTEVSRVDQGATERVTVRLSLGGTRGFLRVRAGR